MEGCAPQLRNREGMDDELQEVRDNFYVGNFDKALQLCEATSASNELAQNELQALVARCCLAIPLLDRLKVMQSSEIPGQKATALLAVIQKSRSAEQQTQAKERLATLAKETQDMSSTMLYAMVLAADGNYAEALKLAKAHPTLEMQAFCVFLCLFCNQSALAQRLLKDMSGSNDDSAAFRLATAAVKLVTGDPEEAYLTYCDLSSQFPPVQGEDGGGSVLLQAGKAVANMKRSMWAEAVEDLQRALAVAPNDPDSLVNMVTCLTHLGKKEEAEQVYQKLEQAAPTHPYVVKTQGMKASFQRFKASMEV